MSSKEGLLPSNQGTVEEEEEKALTMHEEKNDDADNNAEVNECSTKQDPCHEDAPKNKGRANSEQEEEEGDEEEQVKECGCPCGRHWSSLEEEVARDEIWQWAEVEPCCCIPCLRVPDHWYGRHSIHGIYLFCTLTLTLFLAISLFTYLMVCPYCLSTYRFKGTTCLIQNITVNDTKVCGCKGNHGNLPSLCVTESCATVNVVYAIQDGNPVVSVLYETTEDSISHKYDNCSITPRCDGDSVTASHVLEALEEWAYAGNTIPCSYDPHLPSTVILSSDHYKKITVLFLVVTSALCALSSAMILVITLTICGCRLLWQKRAPENIKIKAALRKQQIKQDKLKHNDSILENNNAQVV